jgi:hypothetical protein
VDRAQAFCTMKAGFRMEVDTRVGDEMRVVQPTPAGSAHECEAWNAHAARVAKRPIKIRNE